MNPPQYTPEIPERDISEPEEMTTDIVARTVSNTFMNPVVWQQMEKMAQVFFMSKAFPSYIQNAAQLQVIMQAGYEMGMKPMEALKSLYIVNGQVNVWGAALGRRLREHGWTIKYNKDKDADEGEGVTAIIERKSTKEKYEMTAYFSAAEKSGYTKYNGTEKVGWRAGTNRRLKLSYLALSMLIKLHVPEVLGSASDIQEVAEDYPIDEAKKEKAGFSASKPTTLSETLEAKNEKKEKKPEENAKS